MQIKLIGLIFSFLSLFFFSCIEKIEWESDYDIELLVVEGSFTDEYKKHEIKLTKSAKYFSDEETPAVGEADVSITCGEETITFIESSGEPGVYITEDPVAGTPGKEYTLDILLENPVNEKIAYSATEKMKTGVELDSIQAILYDNPIYSDSHADMDSLMVDIQLFWTEPFVKDNYYKVQVYLKNSVKNNTIDDIFIYRGHENIEGESNIYFFSNFQPNEIIVLESSSVTEDYFQYIDGMKKITNQEQDQFFDFSGPPANAEGNIEGAEALGYFRVSSVSKKFTVIRDGRE